MGRREWGKNIGNAASVLLSPLLISTYCAAFSCWFLSNGRSPPHLYPSPSPLIFILHGSSPLIHPCQATISYKANGNPHLASYFHIRSAVKDRVYTGSGLECKPACLCHRPDCALQTCPHLLPPPAVLAALPPVTIISLHFSLLVLSSSSHLSSIVPPFLPLALTPPVSLHRLFLARQNTKHMHTCTHLAGGGTSEELALRFGTGG